MTDTDTGSDAQEHAQDEKAQREDAREEMKRVEEDPPERLEDWPGGKAKYMTMGGPESDSGYEDGPTEKLGPSDLRHHEDGSVTIGGEEVDNPEDYKGEPIPGGPTDPDAPDDPSMVENERGEATEHAEDDSDDAGSGSGSGSGDGGGSGGGEQDEEDAERREQADRDREGYGDRSN